MVHVFTHQGLGTTRHGSGHDVGVIKGQLVLLCNLHGLRMGVDGQGHHGAAGFDCRQQFMCFGPRHFEFAVADRCDFVEHLNTDAGFLAEQGFSCVCFAGIGRQQVQDDVAVQKGAAHGASLASSRLK